MSELRQLPEFNQLGRYVLDVREVRQRDVEFHDMDNLVDECQVPQIPENFRSRFNNPQWALLRGYQKCKFCQK